MFFLKRNNARIGTVRRRLGIARVYFYAPRWSWRPVHFKKLRIDFNANINPHIAIVGESGSGKSSLCKLLIGNIVRSGINVAVLDPHDEYIGISKGIGAEVYDSSYNGINIFDIENMNEREKASEITGLFRRTFRLGEVQSYTLYRAILYTYNIAASNGRVPGIRDLIFSLKVFKKHARSAEYNVLEGLERRLALIDNGTFSRNADIERIMNGNSVLLMSRLRTAEAQSIYMEGFLRRVYGRMLSSEKSGRARFCVVIDEAEKLRESPILGKIAAEGRKYGIGIIAISQRSKSIDPDLRNNASLFISFYQREPEELNYVANFIAGGNELGRFSEVKKAVRNLRKGSAVVLSSSEREPVIVEFDRNQAEGPNIGYSIVDFCRFPTKKAELFSMAEKLGCSREELLREVKELVAKKQLHYNSIDSDSAYGGVWYLSALRNSAEHDIRVGVISRCLSENDVPNRIYNSSYGPDIIVNWRGRKIAVEYETGTKSIDDTKRMLAFRMGSYQRILVLVNSSCIRQYQCLQSEAVRVHDIEEFISSPAMIYGCL